MAARRVRSVITHIPIRALLRRSSPIAISRSLHSNPPRLQAAEAVATRPRLDGSNYEAAQDSGSFGADLYNQLSGRNHSPRTRSAPSAAQIGMQTEDVHDFVAKEISAILKSTYAPVATVEPDHYWQKIAPWQNVSRQEFNTQKFQNMKGIKSKEKLVKFFGDVMPKHIKPHPRFEHVQTTEDFILDFMEGLAKAPMPIRLTPQVLSVIDWNDPLGDPIRRQFIPMNSELLPDHPLLTLDSLHESQDSPVKGLVHRYPDKVLFLSLDVCPVYCRYCTRSYGIGSDTEIVTKESIKPNLSRWEQCFEYISKTPAVTDVVVSGGDTYILTPDQIRLIGDRLLAIPHIKRIRFATKGLAVSPSRILDPADRWVDEIIRLSWKSRLTGKTIAIHTHFNHPNEFTWITRLACQKLFENAVDVRNQSVLLRGVNDDVPTMSKLIRELADNNIQPYYVYQHDMVKGVEDLRTPLQTILDLECQIRGTIAGFRMPTFVVDLPEGGGKRLAASYETYDRVTGRSTFIAPAVTGRDKENKIYEYYDPIASMEQSNPSSI
ncbi:L-lysine 2,3-aminomutase [Phlyctema vagabunda]|uniref:L-lysine 2,3-aminomutase n=1 Tax=Phlyctema vagabunda TaxID=108571 RepID=A0ABR4P2Y9_9HELO